MSTRNNPALIIFARNPVAGQVKTRLAKDVGDERALEVYQRLLQHTVDVATAVACSRYVYYADYINAADGWSPTLFSKRLQHGSHLGDRMRNGFEAVLEEHATAVIIGTDCFDLRPGHIVTAFERLHTHDMVVGPAADGGYYLLGMNRPHPEIFGGIAWSSGQVLEQTIDKIKTLRLSYALTECLHDVDTVADLARYKDLF